MSYFKLLNLEEKYDIDRESLNQNYFSMQKLCHPDGLEGSRANDAKILTSCDLNKAYSTLKNDLSRAEYMLTLRGVDLYDPAKRNLLSADDLEEIWEELDKIERTSNIIELEEALEAKTLYKRELLSRINTAFIDENIKDALDITVRLKYLANLIENIKLKIKDADSNN